MTTKIHSITSSVCIIIYSSDYSGAPKSGTTWLQKALDAHPQILCYGEGHFANVLLSALDQAMQHYYKRIGKAKVEVYQGETYYSQLTEEEYKFIAQSMMALMFNRRPMSAAVRYIGDKTPANAICMPQLRNVFPKAKFIHIVRDRADVIVSTMKHGERMKIKIENREEYMYLIGQRWHEWNQKAFAFGAKHPEQFHWLRFGDLLYNFEDTFSAILQFLELDGSSSIIAECKAASDFRTLSGGRERGMEDNTSFYRKGICGDWKNYLSQEESDVINKRCSPVPDNLCFVE